MKKKIISYFLVLFSLAVFDKAVKYVDVFSVNLSVQYNGSLMLFIGFVGLVWSQETRNKFERKVLILLSMAFLLRFVLNLIAINTDYEKYSGIVNNNYVDVFTWVLVIVGLIIILWERFITTRQ